MSHYKAVVLDYLQADKAVFVNAECCIHLDDGGAAEKLGQRFSCDAIAIDLRHGAVYLCDSAIEHKLQSLLKKLGAWTVNWDSINRALRRDCIVPSNWRVYVWLFVPRDSIPEIDEKLEHLRQTIGSRFKVKITALEDAQPWRISTWKRHEADWERDEQRKINGEPVTISS